MPNYPLPSHESGLQELADNSIVLAGEQEALITKFTRSTKGY